MSAAPQTQRHPIQADQVLAKAVLRAAKQLGLTQAELGSAIGLHRTAVSRLKNKASLSPEAKSGELALLLIRLARTVFALTGGDPDWIKHFMQSPNQITGGIPRQQIQTIQGLMTVLRFVEALRGKNG